MRKEQYDIADSQLIQSSARNGSKHRSCLLISFDDIDYRTDKQIYLVITAIPSIFAWSRKLPAQKTAEAPEDEKKITFDEKSSGDGKPDHSLSEDELKTKLEEHKKKIKNLQQQLRREKKKATKIIDETKNIGTSPT